MKSSPADWLARLPGPPNAHRPDGARSVSARLHGSMELKRYAPRGRDPQQAQPQDELYIVIAGRGRFESGAEVRAFASRDVLCVPAGREHRFVEFSDDFATRVVFWGPPGWERA